MRRAALTIPAALLLGACGLAQATPTPQPTLQPTPEPTPTGAPTLAPTLEPTPEVTPGPADVPNLAAGSTAITNAPGLRVRSRAGVDQRVITSLGVDARLLVGMGPVFIDGVGWYLVRDADPADPAFTEGWVAAGFMPSPFLVPATFDLPFNPIVVGYAHEGDGEFGPVPVLDANYSVRWVAAVLPGGGG